MKGLLTSSKTAGIVLFIILGFVKLPLEEKVSSLLKSQNLIQPPPDFSLRESLPQMGFAAALGGLRSLVASITYLQAYVAFEDIEWGKVDSLMALTTRLQPREPTYWDDASWHMAYNAASSYLRDEKMRAALRNKLFRDHIQRGIDVVNEGLRYLPDDPTLLIRLGGIYRDRQVNPALAAECYIKAFAHGATPFHERMGAYELVKVNDQPSNERAYEILKRYFDKKYYYPSLLRDLPILEERLNIPQEKRIPKTVKPL